MVILGRGGNPRYQQVGQIHVPEFQEEVASLRIEPMRSLLCFLSVCVAQATIDLLQNEPILLYTDVSPKLRIITKGSAFAGEKGEESIRFESIHTICDPNMHAEKTANNIVIIILLLRGLTKCNIFSFAFTNG
jgi:hypothetical protein